MGAAKEQRDAQAMSTRIDSALQEQVSVSRSYISSITSDSERHRMKSEQVQARAEAAETDLARARAMIARLQAELVLMREERKNVMNVVRATRHHIAISGNTSRKYAIGLVEKRLREARLI